MKSWFSTAAVAACLVLAPVAQAQVSCADVQRTIDSARADFEDIIGEELEDFSFATKFEMPGSTACTIAVEWDALYQCLWVHGSEAEARVTFDALSGVVNDCLNAWKPEGVMDVLPLPDTAIVHTVRSGSGVYQDMEVLVHLNRYDEDNNVDWEVWYEVIYYLV